MGKKKAARKAAEKAEKAAKAARKRAHSCLPKTECCVSRERCRRCPIRMLKEGTLPDGYTVKKRTLVTPDGKKATKKRLAKAA